MISLKTLVSTLRLWSAVPALEPSELDPTSFELTDGDGSTTITILGSARRYERVIKCFYETTNTEPVSNLSVEGLAPEELVLRALRELEKAGLETETILDLVTVLSQFPKLTQDLIAQTRIKSQEARVLLAGIFGRDTVSVDLFHWIWYNATGCSTITKNRSALKRARISSLNLKEIVQEEDIPLLKETFGKYKHFWMALKEAHPDNQRIVENLER